MPQPLKDAPFPSSRLPSHLSNRITVDDATGSAHAAAPSGSGHAATTSVLRVVAAVEETAEHAHVITAANWPQYLSWWSSLFSQLSSGSLKFSKQRTFSLLGSSSEAARRQK